MLTGKRVKNEKRDGKLTWKNIALKVQVEKDDEALGVTAKEEPQMKKNWKRMLSWK